MSHQDIAEAPKKNRMQFPADREPVAIWYMPSEGNIRKFYMLLKSGELLEDAWECNKYKGTQYRRTVRNDLESLTKYPVSPQE